MITAHHDITVTLTSPFPGVSRTVAVHAKDGTIVSLPPELMQRGNALEQKGVLVEADYDFSLHGYNQRGSNKGEMYAAIPTKYLGKTYYFVGFKNSFVSIVALYDDTRVNITFNTKVPQPYNGKTYKVGDTLTVYLSQLSTFQIKGDDLLKTDIKSDKHIAVVSGSTCHAILLGSSMNYCNQLISYVPPIDRLGNMFIVPHISRANYTFVDLFAKYGYSSVSFKISRRGFKKTGTFQGYKELGYQPSTVPYVIKTDHPCIIIQYTTLKNSQTYPSQILIPTVTQYSNHYKFITPSNQPYDNHAAIIIRSDDVSGLRFDGGKIYNMEADIKTVTDTDALYTVISLNITAGQHSVNHVDDDVVFGLILYGFGDRHAYGMPAGLDLSTTND